MNRATIDDHAPLTALPTTGNVFSATWPVRTGDIHSDRNLRLDGIARYLQDAGFDNLQARGALDTHPLWIVRRTVIDVFEPIVWPDRVRLQRWCSGLSSKWCSMRVRIESDSGGLVETEGFWINIDPNTGMPARISEEFTAGLASTAVDTHLHWRRWIDPDTSGYDVSPFPLRSSDFDPFDHVNNAVYWQPVEDALDKEVRSGPFRSLVEYNRPIERGEHVTVRSEEGANTLHIEADGEPRASARWFPLPAHSNGQG